jgi:uncharacterized membrane protein YqhA
MLSDFGVLLGLVQVLVLFVAAYFSYAIHLHNRVSRAWLAVSAGLVLMALHQAAILLVGAGYVTAPKGALWKVSGVLLPFVYSLLLALGLMYMKRNFERFEILEKRAREKMKAFGALSKHKHQRK